MSKYTLLRNKETGARRIRNNQTGAYVAEADQPEEYARLRKRALANLRSAGRDDAMRSLGLTKVRGPVSGKIYWE